jgi:peptidoglycan/LPS O-acetylase OafA/YrhL
VRKPRQADPEPFDVDAVRVVTAATVLWGVALIVALVCLQRLRADGHLWWIPTCVAGLLLGLLGIYVTRRRRGALRRAAQSNMINPPGAV